MSRVLRFSVGALLLSASLGLVACGGGGDGGNNGGGSTSTFTGIISSDDGSQSGSISLVVQTGNPAPPAPTGPSLRDPVNVAGSLNFGAGAIALTGTYEPDGGTIVVTGGGYDLAGGFDGNNRLEGNWAGPGGLAGNFVTTLSASATAYCGSYAADDQSDSGTFSFVVAAGVLLGEAVSDQGGGTIPLDGTVSGGNITIHVPGGSAGLATGTINGSSVSGTYDDQQGTTGTWSGGLCP